MEARIDGGDRRVGAGGEHMRFGGWLWRLTTRLQHVIERWRIWQDSA